MIYFSRLSLENIISYVKNSNYDCFTSKRNLLSEYCFERYDCGKIAVSPLDLCYYGTIGSYSSGSSRALTEGIITITGNADGSTHAV